MTEFKMRWKLRGNHVHVRVFSASQGRVTYAMNGELVFREGEWASFVQCLKDHGMDRIQVLPDEATP